jgi:hypothetical protein
MNDEEHPFLAAALTAVQMLAMALAALVVFNMVIEYANHAPREMCVAFPTDGDK